METSPETRIGAVDTIFDPKGCQIRFSGVILGQVSALRTFFGTQFFWLFGSTVGTCIRVQSVVSVDTAL